MPDRLLDAARECVLDVGWKRTTLTDIAARAGVSRMTVYRTFPDMETLFAELLTREWSAVAGAVVNAVDQTLPWPDRIAQGIVHTVRALRRDELIRRALDLDPEWLLPYLFERRGRSQDAILELLIARISEGQAEGGIRDGEPVALARTLVLTAHGHTLSVDTMTDEDVTESALDTELTELVRRYLAQ